MKKIIYIIPILLLIIVLHNPTSTTIVESNKYKTPANPAFDDDNFYKCVTNRLGVSEDTNVTDEQLASITYLYCYPNDYNDDSTKISSTKGVEKLTGLTSLYLCNHNLTSIDVSRNTALTELNLENNQLTNIDLSHNTVLTNLYLDNNELTSIDVTNNTNLNYIEIDEDTNIIGLDTNTTVQYRPSQKLFKGYDIVFDFDKFDYNLDVDYNVSKVSICENYSGDNMLCGGETFINLLQTASRYYTVYFNNELIDYSFFQNLNTLFEADEEIIEFGEKAARGEEDTLKKDLDGHEFYISYQNGITSEYITLFDIKEGENTLKIIMDDDNVYTLTINRKPGGKNAEEASKELNNILEEITTDNNIKYPPDTGMFTAILLSILSIGIVVELYFVYYRKKVKN